MSGFLLPSLSHFHTPFDHDDMHLPLTDPPTRPRELDSRMAGSEEVRRQREVMEELTERQKARLDIQMATILRLRSQEESYAKKYKRAKERIVELEQEVGRISKAHQEALEEQDRRIQAMADRLTQPEVPLATRSTEPAGAQSTTDGISEAEVLGVVRDINESIFQVAANLTEEWEKLVSSGAPRFTLDQGPIDALSRFYGPALIQSALDQNPAAVTFLVQSCLCFLAVRITSSWRHDRELAMLGSVYQSLSSSGKYTSHMTSEIHSHILEGQVISARWRSLAHKYLSRPPPDPASIVKHVGDVLLITRLFSSTRHSSEFVKTAALGGIETIHRLAQRLEFAFMVEVASSDMSLLFETPDTVFDDTRMTSEVGPDEPSTPERQDKVAGTTEVGVWKKVCGGQGEDPRKEVLLKAKVILEKDVEEL